MADGSAASGASNAPTQLPPIVVTTPSTPSVSPSVIEKELAKLSTLEQFWYPLDLPKYYLNLLVSDYSRASYLTLGTLNPVGNITLPLPTPLIDAHNIAYEDTPIGALLAGATRIVPGMIGRPDTQGTTKNIMGSLPQGVQDVVPQGAKDAVNAAGTLGIAAATNIPGGIGDIIKAFSGFSPNQFFTILLKGPKYKTYEFQWRLSPKSAAEAEMLRKIVRAINNWVAPGLAAFGTVWSFPKVFQISFVPNPKYMYKFKPCVCESFTVNYAPGGQPAFYRTHADTDNLNAPEGLDIAMRFLELEYWITSDYNNNNNGADTSPGPGSTS